MISKKQNKHSDIPHVIRILDKLNFLFFWVRIFYPKVKGIKNYYLFFFFFPQKILRINGSAKWPVHFTSRVLYSKNIKTGNATAPGLSPNCYIQGRNGIKLGYNVRLGPGVGLISANHDTNDFDKWMFSEAIETGNNVWIGMNSVVMPGVKIGDNVIIGANSVVTKNIPSNSIAFGSPCEVVKNKETYRGKDYSQF